MLSIALYRIHKSPGNYIYFFLASTLRENIYFCCCFENMKTNKEIFTILLHTVFKNYYPTVPRTYVKWRRQVVCYWVLCHFSLIFSVEILSHTLDPNHCDRTWVFNFIYLYLLNLHFTTIIHTPTRSRGSSIIVTK